MRALFFHGIGNGTPATFAHKARAWLRGKVPGMAAASVHWGALLDVLQHKDLRDMERAGAAGRPLQHVSFGTLGDALAFRNVSGAINHLADYEASTLGGEPTHIFAHSLGVLVAQDWLRARPARARGVKLLTFGNNSGAFTLGARELPTNQPPAQVAEYTNFFDPEDGIGAPVGYWIPKAVDVRVEVGSWLTGWWGAAHTGYWTCKKLWTSVVPQFV